jgi:hypothetical protein
MKRRKLPEVCPHIEAPSEFGAMWKQWWAKMQPSWCQCESLIRIVPADADWEPILHGGSNGLSLVVMALSWWIDSTKDGGEFDVDLRDAIDDVKWVLSELVATLSPANLETGSKRACKVDFEKRPNSKKWVHIFFP